MVIRKNHCQRTVLQEAVLQAKAENVLLKRELHRLTAEAEL